MRLRNKRKKSKNDSVSGLDNWVTVVPSTELRKKRKRKKTGVVLEKLKLRVLWCCLNGDVRKAF